MSDARTCGNGERIRALPKLVCGSDDVQGDENFGRTDDHASMATGLHDDTTARDADARWVQ